jgi:predicted acyl esterase
MAVIGSVVGVMLASAPAAMADGGLTARSSVEQVQVTGAVPGANLELIRKGHVVQEKAGGDLGGAVFRKVEPGSGYIVREGQAVTPKLTVLTTRSKPPSNGIYDQTIPEDGYGYVTTRDGTQLALDVHLPGPVGGGPYPTLVEYSGYGYANPAGPQSGIAPVANLLGFAVVDVNMRGTGCSGGAFDYFEPLQSLDGYDVIETVARQPWVLGGKVGMMGISYGGISQLFVGATNPPSLAAIAPMSVVDNSQTTLYPGGILNTGFALNWAQERMDDSQPSGPDSGQGWAWQRIQDGDATCAANQALHPEAVDLIQKIRNNSYYRPGSADPLSPETFVDKLKMPVFMACQWTDEQTGGHCPTLASRLTGTKRKWITFTNGVHTDSLDPETFNRWFDFLSIYVAGKKPELSASAKASAPVIYSSVFGVPGVQLPDDPIQHEPDFDSAKKAFEALPPVRVLYDNGAGQAPGAPGPGFERSYGKFPPAGTRARSWYFGNDGQMSHRKGGTGADQFTWNDEARPPTDFTGDTGSGDLWTAHPNYQWSQNPTGSALSYVSSQLGTDTTVLGAGEVQVWVRSEASNVDLQATISEVRPDGKETFVQGGWLRTSARKMDRKKSALTEPVPNLRKRAAQTLPKGQWVKVRIPLYYEGHVYRRSSRIRVTVSAPGGDQPIWGFAEASPDSTPWVAIAHSSKHPSRLVLPVTGDGDAPTGLPPCPSLRGEPCRDYVPLGNEPFHQG